MRTVKTFFLGLLLTMCCLAMPSVVQADGWHTYALACPFFSVFDAVTVQEFDQLWQHSGPIEGRFSSLIMTADTQMELSGKLGKPGNAVIVSETIPSELPANTCAVVRITDLKPLWKRIQVGKNPAPWDAEFDPQTDHLSTPAIKTDYDSDHFTTLLMTGTTALARTTAYKMLVNGINYPAEEIRETFLASDLRHISNESSFWTYCPEPRFTSETMQFCSPLDYWQIFDYLQVQVIELTGNHLRDYDWKPFRQTLDILNENGFGYFGGSYDTSDSDKALLIEDHGNRFAFVGCNIAGPEHVFATETLPGVERCNFDKMETQIRQLRAEGYSVIASIQYYERYSRTPAENQIQDFQRLADAGAVVVSGSQAHYAMTMKPLETGMIHYGLGNLFFDQMENPIKGTTQEFLDRHVFYEGSLLQTELVTARLTDYARPRLMTAEERTAFLNEIFTAAKGD